MVTMGFDCAKGNDTAMVALYDMRTNPPVMIITGKMPANLDMGPGKIVECLPTIEDVTFQKLQQTRDEMLYDFYRLAPRSCCKIKM